MKTKILILISSLLIGFLYKKDRSIVSITVKNTLNIDREFETIELTKEQLKLKDLSLYSVKNSKSGEILVSQTIDLDGDGVLDQLLFQPKIKANSEAKFDIVLTPKNQNKTPIEYCYSRFVPERTDDYAWENNRVAFRTFGPTAQKMIEENIKGGTLSSGIDAWLKRVEYPIINKWYKKDSEKTGSYHEDTGEGVDNFHVGVSRGVGGIAIKNEGTYKFSRNFTKWRTISTGPIRTIFYLEYANWKAGEKEISESKIISLDYGSNLSKFEVTIQGTSNISAGLTLHEKDGEVTSNDKNGWVSYWQPHADSELGTAIVTKKNYFSGYEKYDTPIKDESNAFLHLNVINNKTVYYAGFGWKKSNQFENKTAWENYLTDFSKKLENPMIVTINHKK